MVGCTSNPLGAELRQTATEAVLLVAEPAGVILSRPDATCVAESLGQQAATSLVEGTALDDPALDDPALDDAVLDDAVLATAMANGIVECVGQDTIVSSAIRPQAPEASEESILCAAQSFDEDLVRSLLVDRLSGIAEIAPGVELALGMALAECLSAAELLGE